MGDTMLPPLLVEIRAKVGEVAAAFAETKAGAREAAAAVESEGGKLEASWRSRMGSVGALGKAAFLGIAGVAVAVGAEGVKSAVEYQDSTAKIAANAGITQHAADQVGNAFLSTMGKSTFSAQQIAEAFGPVAGQLKQTEGHALSAADSMTVMQAAMDDAEASGTDLSTTTAALSGVMQAYHLSVGQAKQASDVLFNASKNLNLPIDQVGQAMDKLKGRLGNLAPSMTDTGALLEELGTHGITGTRGVGVMQTALSTLLGNSGTTAKEVKSLGLTLTDAQGNFVGMGSVIDQLSPKLAGMNAAQQGLALANLFGAGSAQVMQQVVAGGVKGFQAATDAISEQGSAQEAAEKQARTWQGTIKTGKAALSDLEVTIGQRLIPVLAKAAGFIADSVRWFSKHKDVAIALGAVVGGALTVAMATFAATTARAAAQSVASLIRGFAMLIPGIEGTTVAMGEADAAMDANPIGAVTLAVAALAAGAVFLAKNWTTVWDGIKTATAAVVDFVKDHIVLILTVALGPLGLAIGELLKHWQAVWSGIKTAVGDAKTFIVNTVGDVVGFFEKLPGRITSAVAHLWDGITAGFKAAVNWVIGAWDAIPHFHIHIPHVPGTSIGGDLDIGLPHIPMLAKGADIVSSGLAVVGDNGPELLGVGAGARVTPLTGGAGGGMGPIRVELTLQVAGKNVGSAIVPDLLAYQRRGGVLAITRGGQPVGGTA